MEANSLSLTGTYTCMFIGQFAHNLDDKGRVQVPVKWRSLLAEGAVVTKGFDGSLKLMAKARFAALAQELSELPQSDPLVRAHVRQTLAGAMDVELDKSGRVVIPPYLRNYASLKKSVVLAGLSDFIELWDTETWNSYENAIDSSSPEATAALKEMGI